MKMTTKIGLGVVTYSRPDYLKQCIDSLVANDFGGADTVVFGIDFKDKDTQNELIDMTNAYGQIIFDKNVGVGPNKNALLERLMRDGCDHIFLMEDDITMLRPDTCEWYIQCAKDYGIEHLNFAHHGPANLGHKKIYWHNDKPVMVHPNCVGAFSYYTRNCIEKVGYIDESFKNVWEHVEHTYRIIQAGLHTPFWYFADAINSEQFLKEIPGSIENSTIRPNPDWQKNVEEGRDYWVVKHGKWIGSPRELWK